MNTLNLSETHRFLNSYFLKVKKYSKLNSLSCANEQFMMSGEELRLKFLDLSCELSVYASHPGRSPWKHFMQLSCC